MKRILSIVLIICLICVPVFAKVDDETYRWILAKIRVWDKESQMKLVKDMYWEKIISKKDLEDMLYPASKEVLPATEEYASIEIMELGGKVGSGIFTVAGGHYYSQDIGYDEREEIVHYYLHKDGEKILEIPGGYGARAILQMEGKVYVVAFDGVYRLSGKRLVKVAEMYYPYSATSDGHHITLTQSFERFRSVSFNGFEGLFHTLDSKERLTQIGSPYKTFIGYPRTLTAANKDLDRIAYCSYLEDGVIIQMNTGDEYTQNKAEIHKYYPGDYLVDAVLYYNNCLLINVKSSLVYFDGDNKPHVLIGNMTGDRFWRDSYLRQAYGSSPVENGVGPDVSTGYVLDWNIGDDGCIYGKSMIDANHSVAFKIRLPEKIKSVETYKKKQ